MTGSMIDIFGNNAFSMLELTSKVERNPYQPMGLGQLGIFNPRPIATTALAVEERNGTLTLIPFSDRGAPGSQRTTEKRKMRYFEVPRIVEEDTIYAHEIQNVREFGEAQQVMTAQVEAARRLDGPTGILKNIEYTKEYHRLAAIQGQLLDADGSIKYDWYSEFGFTRPSAVAFSLSAKTANSIRPICSGIVRNMARIGKGIFIPNQTKVYALTGDNFYDQLTNHPDVIQTFLNWNAAADLRNNTQGAAFDTFYFGGIYWMNYRGSDDTSTIAIDTNSAQFFPVDAPGAFEVAYAPAETFGFANTLGKEVYVIPVFDRDRDMWWKMEAYSHPLHICLRPEMLANGSA